MSSRIAAALAKNPYYANAVPKMVVIGINNESYIEIVSGLNEGDEVILPPVVAAKTGNTPAATAGFGGLGGMGGGARTFVGGGGGGNAGANYNRSGASGNNAAAARSSGASGNSAGGNAAKPQVGG